MKKSTNSNFISIQIKENSKWWLTLLIAPLAVSFSAIIVTNFSNKAYTPFWLWIVTALLILLGIILFLFGYKNKFSGIINKYSEIKRVKNFFNPKILVLNGTIYGNSEERPPVPVQSNLSIMDWKTTLEDAGFNVELGPLSEMCVHPVPDIVINPFGEVYPESDFLFSKSIKEIQEFVWGGGVYVNVAGIPFWYRHDPASGKRDVAGRVERLFEEKSEWKPLFLDLFGNLNPIAEKKVVECAQTDLDIRRFGQIVDVGGESIIGKFRYYPSNTTQLIPILRDKVSEEIIIGGYTYGFGAFLISGVFIDGKNLSFEKVIASIIGWVQYEKNSRKP